MYHSHWAARFGGINVDFVTDALIFAKSLEVLKALHDKAKTMGPTV